MQVNLNKNKTVYILGAGFSYDAYFPLQSEIIPSIYKLNEDISEEPVKFITSLFGNKYIPSLEDVFTLLDQAILHRDNLSGIVHTKLDDIREKLIRAILYVLHSCNENYFKYTKTKFEPQLLERKKHNYNLIIKNSRNFYNSNAAFFIKNRISNGLNSDSFSIISLNWDTLFEDSIYWCKQFVKRFKIDIDYCCYTNALTKDSKHINSLSQRSRRVYNIKVLKLHSSSNWLICPNCNRLFTGLGSKLDIWSLYMQDLNCPKCNKHSRKLSKDFPILIPYLITPTFLKKVDHNPHINMVWHNAFVELSEANRIIFIGYSLPDSDYLLRTLFKRSISEEAEIEIVLTSKDNYPRNLNKNLRNYFAIERYKSFFSQHSITIYEGGVKDYFKRIHGINNFKKIIGEINKK